jgi:hypothetical protein
MDVRSRGTSSRPTPQMSQPFLACQDGCGRPAQWVLIRLSKNRRNADVPASDPLCDECASRRFQKLGGSTSTER